MPKETPDRTRRCIATGEDLAKEQMIRFVVGPDGVVVPDIAGKLPGRGIWLCADPAALQKAMAKKLFPRAAKSRVSVPADLGETVANLLARQALNYLGLARRAGELISGFEKVRAILARGEAAVLLAARDGSEDGRKKLRFLALSKRPTNEIEVPVVNLFSSSELSLALGRENVVHAAFCGGGLAEKFTVECRRLAPFRLAEEDERLETK